MGLKLKAHAKCDRCGKKKTVDVSKVECGEDAPEIIGAVLASHGYAKHGGALLCGRCRRELRHRGIVQ